MKSFLENVVSDLLRKHGSDLSQLTVVFPNKRASLFLNACLARLCDGKPVWSPRYTTISELFRQMSNRAVADPIKLVCELHRSFTEQTGIDETLDHFYGWGQLLLSDFDDIDKCMADADRVLANLADIHEMDDTSYLSEEQQEAIRRFFSSFSADHSTLLRERFLQLWARMAAIYHDFNDRLTRQGLAYEGALYREVVEELEVRGEELGAVYAGTFVFVGFNVLQTVEQRLFQWLRHEGRALFYWDFDDYYLPSDTGQFIARNLADFPNELDREDKTIYGNFSLPKDITIMAAPTENIQARYVSKWLTTSTDSPQDGQATDTAIVLCDEKLLPSVLHSLPDNTDHVNVTTGYPLSQTPVAALVAVLFALRTQGYQPHQGRYRLRIVNAVLRHPYVSSLSPQTEELLKELNEQKIYYPTPQLLQRDEATSLLFRDLEATSGNGSLLDWMCDVLRAVATTDKDGKTSDGNDTKTADSNNAFNMQAEALFRGYTLLNRLQALVTAGDLQVDVITLQRLMTQLMQTTTIPFHGEPAKGLQVMGLLETRCLDFRHVLLLSANEGNLPRGANDTSFIPYALRKAYSLTTADQKVAIYSYYFHRLLQRVSDVTIIYNNTTTDGHTGEMSRFLLQLMVEDPHHHIAMKSLQASQTFTPFQPKPVEKTATMMRQLAARFAVPSSAMPSPCSNLASSKLSPKDSSSTSTPLLTPTAINRYQRCPLIFYYTYIHDLREPDTNDDDTIDNRLFGNIFHEAARIIYSRMTEKSHQILATDIDRLLREKVDIERAVDTAIRQELFRLSLTPSGAPTQSKPATAEASTGPMPTLNGLQIINREVIIHYLRRLLNIDRRLAPFTIIGLETDVTMPFTITTTCSTDEQSAVAPRTASPTLHTIIGGRIDRLDCIIKDGREQIRVIDYKTGSHVPSPLPSVEAIFEQEQLKNHNDYYLQTFLYATIVSSRAWTEAFLNSHIIVADAEMPTPAVAPALLFIQHAGADDYSPVLKFGKEYINDVAPHAQTFMDHLTEIANEIFSPDVPFRPTADRSRCTNCPYRLLCQ